MPARGNARRHHVGLGSLTACAVVCEASSGASRTSRIILDAWFPAAGAVSSSSLSLAHHDVAAPQVDPTAFRQGWRVDSRLMLHAAGKITAGELQAAVDYYHAVARILRIRGVALRERADGGWRNGTDLSNSKLDAAEHLRLTHDTLANSG